MPGLMVIEAPLPTLTAPCIEPGRPGAGRLANGSAAAAALVIGLGLKLAWPVIETPPTTAMPCADLMTALPLPAMALEDVESTSMKPGTTICALPESVRAPLAEGLST